MDFLYFLGRFHVLVLHLPIGIIVAVFVLEWLARKQKYQIPGGGFAVPLGRDGAVGARDCVPRLPPFRRGLVRRLVGKPAPDVRYGGRADRDGGRVLAHQQLRRQLQARVLPRVGAAARARVDHGALRRQSHARLHLSRRVRAAADSFARGPRAAPHAHERLGRGPICRRRRADVRGPLLGLSQRGQARERAQPHHLSGRDARR